MANLKELRGRIKSVASIAQITGAMEMVASMKLRKVQAKAQSFHPYTEEIRHMIDRLSLRVAIDAERPLFMAREVETVGYFLLTSDRGLCGSFNTNLLMKLRDELAELEQAGKKVKFWCYGRKGYTWLQRRGYEVERYFVEPALDKADFTSARLVGDELVAAFLGRSVDEVRLCYTAFASVARFVPTMQGFLPVTTIEFGDEPEDDYELDFLLEPNATAVFNQLMPRYLETVVYDSMLQSLASEHASRRMAMKGATDAAGRMTKDLKKVYNRARQETITKELLDIIGGANAVG